jgi:hypothetical protein
MYSLTYPAYFPHAVDYTRSTLGELCFQYIRKLSIKELSHLKKNSLLFNGFHLRALTHKNNRDHQQMHIKF